MQRVWIQRISHSSLWDNWRHSQSHAPMETISTTTVTLPLLLGNNCAWSAIKHMVDVGFRGYKRNTIDNSSIPQKWWCASGVIKRSFRIEKNTWGSKRNLYIYRHYRGQSKRVQIISRQSTVRTLRIQIFTETYAAGCNKLTTLYWMKHKHVIWINNKQISTGIWTLWSPNFSR